MAEVLAVAGSVAAILQLTDYSKRFLKFLNEYQAKTTDLPVSFRLILSQQHLLIRSLETLEARAQQRKIDDEMIPHFQSLSDACRKEMEYLDSVLNKLASSGTSSRAKKAIKAIRYEKEIRRSAATLKECFNTLSTAYQIYSIPFDQAPSTVVSPDSNDSERPVTLDEPTQPTQETQKTLVLTTGEDHHGLQQITSMVNRCNCKRREFVQSSTSWSLGPASGSSEVLMHHRSGCPFRARRATQHRLSFNLKYTSLMLNIIAGVSMSMKYGPGGLSLSPNLTLRGMMREDSPAFRLFDRAEWDDCHTVADAIAKMNQVSLRLQHMYHKRIASPYDLDRNGNSLIWVCSS